jgi:hypothetical protein
MLHHPLLDLLHRGVQFLVLFEVIIGHTAGGFFVPGSLLFKKSPQKLLFALLGVLEELVSLDFLTDLVNEGLKFVLGLSQLSLDSFFRLITSEKLLRIVEGLLRLFSIDVEISLEGELLIEVLGDVAEAFYSLIFNFLLLLFLVALGGILLGTAFFLLAIFFTLLLALLIFSILLFFGFLLFFSLLWLLLGLILGLAHLFSIGLDDILRVEVLDFIQSDNVKGMDFEGKTELE